MKLKESKNEILKDALVLMFVWVAILSLFTGFLVYDSVKNKKKLDFDLRDEFKTRLRCLEWRLYANGSWQDYTSHGYVTRPCHQPGSWQEYNGTIDKFHCNGLSDCFYCNASNEYLICTTYVVFYERDMGE